MAKIMIVGGGTGGHVSPGIAVAHELLSYKHDVCWVGALRGMEKKLVEAEGICFVKVSAFSRQHCRGIRMLLLPWYIVTMLLDSLRVILYERPALVLGMGGYVATGICLMAVMLRIPLVLCEQNAVAGRINRFFRSYAKQVYAGFPGAFSDERQVSVVGNPIRPEILNAAQRRIHMQDRQDQQPLHVLVLGGSQGAQKINEWVVGVIAEWQPNVPCDFWHQTGSLHYPVVERAYQRMGATVQCEAYLADPSAAYLWADCVIARAGAMTVSELAVMGLPSILIPYPHAKDDHQTHNAQYLSHYGAAFLLSQNELNVSKLRDYLMQWVSDRAGMQRMATQARARAKLDAHILVAQGCLQWLPTKVTAS